MAAVSARTTCKGTAAISASQDSPSSSTQTPRAAEVSGPSKEKRTKLVAETDGGENRCWEAEQANQLGTRMASPSPKAEMEPL